MKIADRSDAMDFWNGVLPFFKRFVMNRRAQRPYFIVVGNNKPLITGTMSSFSG